MFSSAVTVRRASGFGFVSVNTGGALGPLILGSETEAAVEETEASAADSTLTEMCA